MRHRHAHPDRAGLAQTVLQRRLPREQVAVVPGGHVHLAGAQHVQLGGDRSEIDDLDVDACPVEVAELLAQEHGRVINAWHHAHLDDGQAGRASGAERAAAGDQPGHGQRAEGGGSEAKASGRGSVNGRSDPGHRQPHPSPFAGARGARVSADADFARDTDSFLITDDWAESTLIKSCRWRGRIGAIGSPTAGLRASAEYPVDALIAACRPVQG